MLHYKIAFYEKTIVDVKAKYNITKSKINRLRHIGYNLSDPNAIKDMFPTYSTTACHLLDLEDIITLIRYKIETLTTFSIKQSLKDICDKLNSLIGNVSVKQKLIKLIVNLSHSWRSFTKVYNNFCIMGKTGVGKTLLSNTIAFVFSKMGILSTDHIFIVSRSDVIAQYVGQTAARTKSLLMSSLEGVLFIDEAYSLIEGSERDYGREAITELVNFLDKYLSMCVVIVAGYEKLMMKKFLPSNDGLSRRFPHKIKLSRYSDAEYVIIIISIIKNIVGENISDDVVSHISYNISNISLAHKTPFMYHAGDMVTIGNYVSEEVFSLGEFTKECVDKAFIRFKEERWE